VRPLLKFGGLDLGRNSGAEIRGPDGTFPSDTIPPISRLPSPVRHRKDHDPRRKLLMHKAEGKLPESIFSEIQELDPVSYIGLRVG